MMIVEDEELKKNLKTNSVFNDSFLRDYFSSSDI